MGEGREKQTFQYTYQKIQISLKHKTGLNEHIFFIKILIFPFQNILHLFLEKKLFLLRTGGLPLPPPVYGPVRNI